MTMLLMAIFFHLILAANLEPEGIGVGRFPNHHTSCKSYRLCAWVNNRFMVTNFTCPTTTVFDPRSQQCSRTYKCADFICEKQINQTLNYYDPNNVNCTTYIKCVGNGTDIHPEVKYCNPGQVFYVQFPYYFGSCNSTTTYINCFQYP